MSSAAESSPAKNSEAGPSSSSDIRTRMPIETEYFVEHVNFKWTIENFNVCHPVCENYCLSPIFFVMETGWLISLSPKGISGEDTLLSLTRFLFDDGPPIVSVSSRLGFEYDNNKLWFKSRENTLYKKGDIYDCDEVVLDVLEGDDSLSDSFEKKKTLSVLCEMYVSYERETIKKYASKKISAIDPALSKHMIDLHQTKLFADAVIECQGFMVTAHRSILCVRSKTLEKMFETASLEMPYVYLDCNPTILNCVLLYMYSGCFTHLAGKAIFSVGSYELARELALDKLSDLLTPHTMESKSKVVVEDFNIFITVQQFQLKSIFSESVVGEFVCDKERKMAYRFTMKEMISHDILEFGLEILQSEAPLYITLEMYLLDKRYKPEFMIPAISSRKLNVTSKRCLYKAAFSFVDVVDSFSFDGNLYFKILVTRHFLVHIKDKPNSGTRTKKLTIDIDIEWLKDLSTDLQNLFLKPHYSDVTLALSSGESFQLHRSILASRSRYFKSILFNDQVSKQIYLTLNRDVKWFILDAAFLYIYSGALPEKLGLNNQDVLEIYETCTDYDLEFLKIQLANCLTKLLDRTFVFEVLSVAKSHNDLLLIHNCNEYIKTHIN